MHIASAASRLIAVMLLVGLATPLRAAEPRAAALGAWLPRVPNSGLSETAHPTRTTVHDEIVDPAGPGERVFLDLRGVRGGTFFVYGMAGPPKVHLLYDVEHGIAFYDEGCCSWHHVALISNVAAPPERVATRPLLTIHSSHGVRIGATPDFVRSAFGDAPLRSVAHRPHQSTLSYRRTFVFAKGYSACYEDDTFLFDRARLIGMDYANDC